MVYNFEEKIINTPCFFCRIHINPQMIFLMELCLFSIFLKLIQTIYKYAYTYMLFHILVLSIHNDSYIILFINLTMEYTLKILLLVHILGQYLILIPYFIYPYRTSNMIQVLFINHYFTCIFMAILYMNTPINKTSFSDQPMITSKLPILLTFYTISPSWCVFMYKWTSLDPIFAFEL